MKRRRGLGEDSGCSVKDHFVILNFKEMMLSYNLDSRGIIYYYYYDTLLI